MKNLFTLVAICIFWIFNASTVVAGGVYLNGNLGAVWLLDSDLSQSDGTKGTAEYDTGFGITGALGYDFGMVRIEGEVGYRKNDYDKVGASGQNKVNGSGDVSGLDFMANAYLDIENETSFTPYIGGGIGAAILKSSDINAGSIVISSDDDTVFAYQFIAGAAYSITEAWMLQLEYRFFGTANPTFGITESEYMSHNLFFGIRLNF
jgi:opacity protein-like surface antigen